MSHCSPNSLCTSTDWWAGTWHWCKHWLLHAAGSKVGTTSCCSGARPRQHSATSACRTCRARDRTYHSRSQRNSWCANESHTETEWPQPGRFQNWTTSTLSTCNWIIGNNATMFSLSAGYVTTTRMCSHHCHLSCNKILIYLTFKCCYPLSDKTFYCSMELYTAVEGVLSSEHSLLDKLRLLPQLC